MKKTFLLKPMLLLLAMIAGVGSVWGQDTETIASATFNGKNGIYTEGWSTTGTGKGRTDCIIIGAGENITSPAFDLTNYSEVSIKFTGRRYGQLSGSKATVDVAIGGMSQGTIDITNGNVGSVSGSIDFTPTSSMTAAVLVFTCTNATSAGSTHGAGIGSITIMGTKKGGDTPTPVSTYTVTYDCNGGVSGCPDDLTGIEKGTSITLADAPTKTDYTFGGWNDGTTTYEAGYSYTVNGNVTFTAQWTENTSDGITWEKANLADLTSSDVFVIVGNNGETYALSNDNGTGSAPTAVEVTIVDDKLVGNPTANIRWTISGNATDGYTFHPDGDTEKWLYCINSNNGVRVGDNANKTFVINYEYLFHKGTNRFVGIYGSQDWRCYTSINSNIQYQTFAFYKKVNVNDPSVATTVTIDATGITNTNVFDGTAAGTLTATVQAAGGATVEGAEVTWTSSEEGVATINADGVVTLVAAGTTTITAQYAGVEGQYKASTATYELTVTNTDPNQPGTENNPYTVAQARAAIDAGAGIEGVYAKGIVSEIVTEYNFEYGNITYNISADGTTTADQLEVYRGKSYNGENFTSADDIQVGDEVVVYGTLQKYSGTYEFAQGNQLVSLNRPEDTTPKITVVPAEVEATADETEGTLTVTYKNVEELDVILCDAAGETTTYDWFEAEYNAETGSVDYLISANTGDERTAYLKVYGMDADANDVWSNVVTITQAAYEAPLTAYYEKVTSTADITDGQYLIVYEDASLAFNGGLETLDDESNTIEVEISDNKIAPTTTTRKAEFTIDVTAGTLKSESGAYIGVSSNSNGLKTADDATTYTNAFSIDEFGNAVIAAVFEGSTMTLRYNKASNQARFRYYKSGQEAIQLYKYVNTNPTSVTVTAKKEYTTFCSTYDLDFSQVEGLEAYVVPSVSNTAAVINKVNKVPAGTGLILKKTVSETEFTVPVATETDNIGTNLMVGVTVATDMTEVANAYILSDGLFYACSGGTLAAGKAYLVADEAWATSTAPSFSIVEGGEATGLSEELRVNSEESVYYDLSGRRVAQPTNGVYIVNGKKVLVP